MHRCISSASVVFSRGSNRSKSGWWPLFRNFSARGPACLRLKVTMHIPCPTTSMTSGHGVGGSSTSWLIYASACRRVEVKKVERPLFLGTKAQTSDWRCRRSLYLLSGKADLRDSSQSRLLSARRVVQQTNVERNPCEVAQREWMAWMTEQLVFFITSWRHALICMSFFVINYVHGGSFCPIQLRSIAKQSRSLDFSERDGGWGE
jgi:hypothetical protein